MAGGLSIQHGVDRALLLGGLRSSRQHITTALASGITGLTVHTGVIYNLARWIATCRINCLAG
jgi:hypothetical protein